MNISTLQRLKELKGEVKSAEAELMRERNRIQSLRSEIDRLEDIIAQETSDLNVDLCEEGRRVIEVSGAFSIKANERHSAVQLAIDDLLDGGQKLLKGYFGVKNYDGFGDQGSDHEYGYGPKHGQIVFRVGLPSEAWQNKKTDFSKQEITAAIYYLMLLRSERISNAKP